MPEYELSAEQIKRKRIRLLVMSTIALLFLGLIYGFSMFAKPMIQDFGLPGVGFTFNIMMIAFCVGCTASSFAERAIGVRGCLLVAALAFALGFCLTGLLAPRAGTIILYVCYAAIGGIGVGFGYNTIIATTNVWFPERVGISSGILLLGFGISSLVCGNLALALRSILGSMQIVLIIIGLVGGGVAVVLSFMLRKPPATIVAQLAPEKLDEKGLELGEEDNILKTPIFYCYYIANIVMVVVSLSVIGYAASDASTLGAADSFASLLVGLISTANGVARILVGLIADRFTIKVAATFTFGVAVLASVLIVIAFSKGMLALYCIGAIMCGISYGGSPVIGSTFVRLRYGAKKYALNFSIINFALAFGSIANIGLASALGVDNRLGIFTVICFSLVAAFALMMVFCRFWIRDVESKMRARNE